MTSYEINQVVFSIFLAVGIGLYAVFTGWLMFKMPSKHAPIHNRIKAMLLERQIKDFESSSRKHGISRIVVGGIIIVGGILQILGLFLSI